MYRCIWLHSPVRSEPCSPFAFTPLDRGTLDMNAIVKALRDIDFSGWITAELDSWPDPKEGAVRSMEFLHKAEANHHKK